MARLISMPKLSDTMEEGAIASWLKSVGDKIREGDPLAEIETDKATMEYEAPEDGFILKFLLDGGDKTKVGMPIAILGDAKGEAFDESELVKAVTTANDRESSASKPAPQTTANPLPVAGVRISAGLPAINEQQQQIGGRIKASPLARKIARERGVDLTRLSGSGPHGRVIARDIDQAPHHRPAAVVRDDQAVRVSMMRQTIAKRLLAAKNEAPHFYLSRSIDMSRVMDWRKGVNTTQGENGTKVSVNDIIIFAVARALKEHPMVNASWQGDQIIQYGGVHVAMAVALPEGLVTPVVRHADQMRLVEIAKTTKSMASKARKGELTNEDFSGGTFTISNLGMMGIEEFTAIINPPQAAILAIGTTIKTPVVDENEQVVVKPMMKVTMSCDHRVVDGLVGAKFLQTLVNYLEEPLAMLSY
jgi:pyruvate dehydrogenase E2 component (dihydrolipoamide acetyltransferase)